MADQQSSSQHPHTWAARTGAQQRQKTKSNGSTPPPSAGATVLEMGGTAQAAAIDLVDGLPASGEIILFHGKSGSGKTAMMLSLAVHRSCAIRMTSLCLRPP
jgi:DNA helicase TIP49 (TBP-interacting protein)